MKRIGWLVLGIAISLLAVPGAWAIEITDAVHRNYKAYMFHIDAGRSGAFAVSPRGDHSSFVYCTDAGCDADQAARAAIEKCRATSSAECQLMAYNEEIRIPFTVVAGEKAGDEILAGVLDADRLKQVVVGNTLQGEYPNGRKWSEYFDASGDIRGRDEDQGTYQAKYTFAGDSICFDYAGTFDDWCGQISMRGNRVDFLKNDELQTFIRNTVLLDGNPNNL